MAEAEFRTLTCLPEVIGDAQEALEEAGLIVEVSLENTWDTRSFWIIVNEAITEHLKEKKICLHAPPKHVTKSPNALAWSILAPGPPSRKKMALGQVSWVPYPLTPAEFQPGRFLQVPLGPATPNWISTNHDDIFIFVCMSSSVLNSARSQLTPFLL